MFGCSARRRTVRHGEDEQRDDEADGDEQQRQGHRGGCGDVEELEAVDGGVEYGRRPERPSSGLVEMGERQRGDRRDGHRSDADRRTHGQQDRHVGDGDQRHGPQHRGPERAALAQPAEGVTPPDQLLGDPVEGEDAQEHPCPVGSQNQRCSGHHREQREHTQNEGRDADRRDDRASTRTAEPVAPPEIADGSPVQHPLDDHGGQQHHRSRREMPSPGGIGGGEPGEHAVEHCESEEEARPRPPRADGPARCRRRRHLHCPAGHGGPPLHRGCAARDRDRPRWGRTPPSGPDHPGGERIAERRTNRTTLPARGVEVSVWPSR